MCKKHRRGWRCSHWIYKAGILGYRPVSAHCVLAGVESHTGAILATGQKLDSRGVVGAHTGRGGVVLGPSMTIRRMERLKNRLWSEKQEVCPKALWKARGMRHCCLLRVVTTAWTSSPQVLAGAPPERPSKVKHLQVLLVLSLEVLKFGFLFQSVTAVSRAPRIITSIPFGITKWE